MLAEAASRSVEVQALPHDPMNLYYVRAEQGGGAAPATSGRRGASRTLSSRRVIYRFGATSSTKRRGELRRDGAPVAIQPKPLALLRPAAARARARGARRRALRARSGPTSVVTPGSLTRAVSLARRAIGDTHRGRR